MPVPTSPLTSQPMRFIGVAGLAAVLVLGLLVSPASAANSEEERIAETREELQEVREELQQAREQADDDAVALEDADRQLQAVFTAVETAQQAVARQRDAVADAERTLAEAQATLVAQQQRMGERISRIYRQGRPDPLIQVLDASSASDAVQLSTYITAIGRQDRATVEGLANARTEVDGRKRALEAEQVALDGALVEQQQLLEEVEEIRNDRELVAAASADLVARLQSREDHLEEEAAELVRIMRAQQAAQEAAEQAEALADQVADADGDGEVSEEEAAEAPPMAAPAPPPPSGGGGFSWPAGGTVTSGFGPRWGRNHDGIDIAGGTGSPVAAARGGTVIHAGTLGGYGNLVMIAHSGGFVTAYAHLSSIAVSQGQSVGSGTYLGGMGCTGSCTGTHLHFEIRAGGTPVDPMAYL